MNGRTMARQDAGVPGAGERYDRIGRTYTATRREDPRIAEEIHDALGPGSVVNVGAGSGNYEPAGRRVVAVEPSFEMLRQRPATAAPAVRGVAEALLLGDGAFDVAMAILTVHHWTDAVAGLRELRRVAQRQVVFYFESLEAHGFWALEYFPAALALPTEQDPPGEQLLREHLDVVEVRRVLVPADCVDGFGTAFWARPEAYLEPAVQAGMSWMALQPAAELRAGTARLRAHLESGEWDRRFGHLRRATLFDGGYRIAVAQAK